MANIALPNRLPAPSVSGTWRIASQVRQYPIFPVAILLIVLVIPAIFANQIAPP